MKVLIAVSSRHGSTREIGTSIGEAMREAGVEVDVLDARDVESVARYDAVIVGSAVHMGRWIGPARDLVRGGDHRDWPAIHEWAASIATGLTAPPAGGRRAATRATHRRPSSPSRWGRPRPTPQCRRVPPGPPG
jgi:hypothetical protein